MSIEHHVDLSPEERAELERRDAEEHGTYVRAIVASVRSGEEPVPLPGKTWIRRANDCATVVACLSVILLYAWGASKLAAVIACVVLGAAAGALFFKAPRIADHIIGWLHNRRSERVRAR